MNEVGLVEPARYDRETAGGQPVAVNEPGTPAMATLKQDRRHPEIDAAILDRVADRDVAQRLAVIEFRGDPGADVPAHAGADARDLLRIRGRPVECSRPAQNRKTARSARSRPYPNRRDRGDAAGRPGSAARPRRETRHRSPSDRCDNRAPSRARQTRSAPFERAADWRAGGRSGAVSPSPRRCGAHIAPGRARRRICAVGVPGSDGLDHGGTQGLQPEAEGRARGKGVLGITVEPVLVEAQRRHDRLSVGLGAGRKGKRHPEQKRLRPPLSIHHKIWVPLTVGPRGYVVGPFEGDAPSLFIVPPRAQASRRCETQATLSGKPPDSADRRGHSFCG